MEASTILGSTAFLITIIYLVLDYPVQNYFSLQAEVPPTLWASLKVTKLLMFASWMMYGWVKNDAFFFFGQGLGMMSAFLVVGIMLWYKKLRT